MALLSGCGLTAKSYSHVESSFDKTVSIDLQITEKISGEATGTLLLGRFVVKSPSQYAETVDAFNGSFFGKAVENIKSAAVYDAIKNGKCDEIVNPIYKVKCHNKLFGVITKCEVTVTGYGAKRCGVTIVEN